MIASQWALKLEELVFGKCDSIEFCEGISRDEVIEEINHLIVSCHPNVHLNGKFLNPNESNYLAYDLCVSDITKFDFNSIRILDFGNKLQVVRI